MACNGRIPTCLSVLVRERNFNNNNNMSDPAINVKRFYIILSLGPMPPPLALPAGSAVNARTCGVIGVDFKRSGHVLGITS